MNEQLPLFEAAPSREGRFELFLALFPDPALLLSIQEQRDAVRRKHGVIGSNLPLDRLHVSLLGFGSNTSDFLIKTVCRTAVEAARATPPFDVEFGYARGFRKQPGGHPLVLTDDGTGNRGLRKFQQLLLDRLAGRTPSSAANSRFSPHLTLLYGDQIPDLEAIEPIGWTVNEIVLVRSAVGEGRYDYPGRWPLEGIGAAR